MIGDNWTKTAKNSLFKAETENSPSITEEKFSHQKMLPDSTAGVFRRYHAGNNPVNAVDPSGLTAVAIGGWWEGGIKGLLNPMGCQFALWKAAILLAEVSRHKLTDKYGHCVAFCEIGRGCGKNLADFLGVNWEKFQELTGIGVADPEDIEADRYGINAPSGVKCKDHCKKRYNPCPE